MPGTVRVFASHSLRQYLAQSVSIPCTIYIIDTDLIDAWDIGVWTVISKILLRRAIFTESGGCRIWDHGHSRCEIDEKTDL